jgi:hypothetical protein
LKPGYIINHELTTRPRAWGVTGGVGVVIFVTALSPAHGGNAINWIIANQLGRRNITPEQKSYLRGKRYNLEKQSHGGERHAEEASSEKPNLKTAQKLAKEYRVNAETIVTDGQFAEAVDTLDQQVRRDIKQAVMARKSRDDKERVTKRQVTQAGQAVKEYRVEPQPFMLRAHWKEYQVIEAIDLYCRRCV